MKQKIITIGLIQTKVAQDRQANLEKTVKMIAWAAKKGAQIVCLQELFQTIYFPQYKKADKDKYAEAVPGAVTNALSVLAKELGVVIIAPVFEKKNGRYYNCAAVINEKGKLLPTYHKIHIPQDRFFYEKNYFEQGSGDYKIHKTKFCRLSALICYDQWFPEAARMAALAGAEIIFYPTAIGGIVGHKSKDGDWHGAWETVMRGHAIANSVAVAAVNRVGREDKLRFWGQSFVCDSFGKVIGRASATKEQALVVKVDLSRNLSIREGWGFFKNRRPDTYRLTEK